LIQVSNVSSREEIEKREIDALIKASDELSCDSLTLITDDYEDEIHSDTNIIHCIPLWK